MNNQPKILDTNLKSLIKNSNLHAEIPNILSSFKFITLKKNEFLVEIGTVCPYFCYIEEGVLQHAIPIQGEEKTTYLALENTVTTALKSFKQKSPSRKNIKALCTCKLWVLDLDSFQNLMTTNKAFQSYYHTLIENQIFLIDDYRINLLTLSPEERYSKLLQNHPSLLQQIPLHYLASFLGISSRHMSRIRKNIK